MKPSQDAIFCRTYAYPPTLLPRSGRRSYYAWGRFTFRAYWLDPYDHCDSALIGITIQRQEALAIAIARQLQHLPLSPRLKDVCLLFAQGQTQRQIAEHLHLSNYTVSDYVRAIYDKLGVRSREDLLKKLKGQLIH